MPLSRGIRITALLLAGLLLAACAKQEQTPVTGTSFLMDTIVEYKLYGKNAAAAKGAIEEELSGIESRMSMYLPGSEIAKLNENAGRGYVSLSEDTYELLSRCVQFGEASGGAFDVTIAPLTAAWGVTSDHPQVPDGVRIETLRALVDYRDILLNPTDRSAMLRREGQAVDVGGVAKGYACDAARRVAKAYGIESGYISIGGNIMAIGEKPGGEPFKFGVRDPRGGGNDYIAVMTLPDSTMATSGDYERYFERDEVRYHHILDPATGYPADTGLMSVSVVSPDGAYADSMSTCLFIKGRDYVLANLNALDCGLVVIDRDRNVYVSENLRGQFTPADPGGTYHFKVAS